MADCLDTKEKSYRPARLNRVIVCDDLNFFYDEPELIEMKNLWKKGMSVADMAERFRRDPDEILVALIHLARKNEIYARKRGLK
ncbi:hypothetical protein HPT25_23610 [Bacillus sp. BRMEA1]|uniref:hypothetical protein n=1 Tax=Neobacillus endophyticus TaxID=2738405 RepID=UPI001565BFDF|nr:hypothetical protein [Neobacillus endophyticus]NRD80313.1 hypothetical protein [Neobacillus endophyticus]